MPTHALKTALDALQDQVDSLGAGGLSFNLINPDTTWTVRPDATVVLWIGGGPADDPTLLMEDGDLWFPSSTV